MNITICDGKKDRKRRAGRAAKVVQVELEDEEMDEEMDENERELDMVEERDPMEADNLCNAEAQRLLRDYGNE